MSWLERRDFSHPCTHVSPATEKIQSHSIVDICGTSLAIQSAVFETIVAALQCDYTQALFLCLEWSHHLN